MRLRYLLQRISLPLDACAVWGEAPFFFIPSSLLQLPPPATPGPRLNRQRIKVRKKFIPGRYYMETTSSAPNCWRCLSLLGVGMLRFEGHAWSMVKCPRGKKRMSTPSPALRKKGSFRQIRQSSLFRYPTRSATGGESSPFPVLLARFHRTACCNARKNKIESGHTQPKRGRGALDRSVSSR